MVLKEIRVQELILVEFFENAFVAPIGISWSPVRFWNGAILQIRQQVLKKVTCKIILCPVLWTEIGGLFKDGRESVTDAIHLDELHFSSVVFIKCLLIQLLFKRNSRIV